MSDTLIKTPCGCTVRGNRHTWDYRQYTVEIRDIYGLAVRTVEVPANDDVHAESLVAQRGYAGNVRVYPASWTYHSIGYATMRGECCTDSRICTGCMNRIIDGL
ncbi:hypothetical protein ACIRVF_11450 [Kitasatospora sp. NPDC101157]|uniref:hypothetical protein n=1 Tax=Kitasatospora sp. NPDC101157 TaxID=3364098 RepID=UPI003821789A